MRRFLPGAVIAVLAIAVATPVNAGYLIIRVILDGSGSGASAGGSESGPGMSLGGGGKYGSGGQMQQPGPGSGRPGAGAGGIGGGGMLPGGRPGGLFGMGGGGAAADSAFVHDPSRSIVVVIPIEEDLNVPTPFYRGASNSHTNPIWKPKTHLNHRGQRFVTNLFSDNSSIQWYDALLKVPTPRKTRATEIKELHYTWTKSKSDPKVLFTVLTRALEAGIIDDPVNHEDALTYADELLAYATEKPDGLPAEIAAFVKAYKAMQKGIKSPPAKPSIAEVWKSRLDGQGVHTQGHYALIYSDATSGEVQRRAAMLEENFKGFYLWHATRGVELPMPEAPLLAVLAKSAAAAFDLARALDGPARVTADGFYSIDHDLLILAPERLDEVGQTFVRQAQQVYKSGASRDLLLAGQGPKLHINGLNDGKRPEEVARMQTIALVDRLIEDESAIATISREGSRQLLYSTGRLPRYVALPDWLSHGSSNFFTRPKDPAFITNAEGKTSMAVAIATGYGGPNYVLQRYFKDLLEKKELNADRAALLKNVLTDAYFRGSRDLKDIQDPDPAKAEDGIALHKPGSTPMAGAGTTGGYGRPGTSGSGYGGSMQRPGGGAGAGVGAPPLGLPGAGGPPGPGFGTGGLGGDTTAQATQLQDDPSTLLRKKRDRLDIKAQATAWALYYYLVKERPNELQTFLTALAALPRDLPLDGDTVLTVFCQSLALDGSKESLTKFANEWLDSIRTVPPAAVVPDIPLVEAKASTTNPLGGPGGSGPGGSGDGGDR